MLKMVDIEYIRKKHLIEGWSIRRIARQAEVSRQTVRKALQAAGPWQYTLSQPKPCPVMAPYREIIRGWLQGDQAEPRKQRHTAKRIYARLCQEHGFRGADSTVRRYVARLRRELAVPAAEPFLLLQPDPGEMAQVDWGEAYAMLEGVERKVYLFCIRLHYSGVAFAWAALHTRMEAFLEGHVRALNWMEGIPRQLVYDNLASAVRKVLGGHERQLNERFLALRSHYLFDSLFCNPGAGHEKGGVENLIGYVRRNALSPRPVVSSLAELNQQLLAWCVRERERLQAKWEVERSALRPLPVAAFRACVETRLPVSKLALITYDRNRYSVPGQLRDRGVRVDVFTDRLEVWYQGQQVAEHERQLGRNHTSLQLQHYLGALARKPFAVMHAAVVRALPEVYQQARRWLCQRDPTGYRELVKILLLHHEFDAQALETAVGEGLATRCLTAEAIRQRLLNRQQSAAGGPAPVLLPPSLAGPTVAVGAPSRYDELLKAGVS